MPHENGSSHRFSRRPYVDSTEVLAKAIRAARTRAGLSVTNAAMVAGVSMQTLVDVEAGRPEVSIGKLLQIADALGVSLFVVPAARREPVRSQLREGEPGESAR
jgi:transcriptional regulator with XRE-family HTH domain